VTDDLREQMTNFDSCVLNRDAALADAVLDDDYMLMLVAPSPALIPRGRWLDVLPDYIVHSYSVQHLDVHIDGDAAAVLQRVDMQATVLGEDRSGVFVITDIWRRRPDGWRVWRRHSTPLQAGPMPGG